MNGLTDSLLADIFHFSPADPDERLLMLLSVSIGLFFVLAAFFAVLTIGLRVNNNRRERMWQNLHGLWDNDILAVLAGDMAIDEFRQSIPPERELDFVKYLTPYAWRLTGSDLVTLSALAAPFLHHVADKLRHRNPEIRAWAINALSLLGMPKYTPQVLQHLRDPSSVVAMSAANALLQQRKVSYIEPVLTYFHRFDHWNIASLVNLISQCGTDAIPVLRRIYLDPAKAVRTRIVAAESLSELNDYGIAEAIPPLLKTETDQELLAASLRLLGDVGQSGQRDVVIALCQSDNEVIRVNAVRTLRQLGTRDDIPLLRQAVFDPSPWVAVQAALGLHDLGDDGFLSSLADKGHSRASLAMQVLAGDAA